MYVVYYLTRYQVPVGLQGNVAVCDAPFEDSCFWYSNEGQWIVPGTVDPMED